MLTPDARHYQMKILLFDTPSRKKLFPLTLTRANADLRIGIFTLRERWEKLSGLQSVILTEDYLQDVYGAVTMDDYILVDACLIPSPEMVKLLRQLKAGEALADANGLIMGRPFSEEKPVYGEDLLKLFDNVSTINSARRIEFPYHLFQWNGEMISADFQLATMERISKKSVEGVNIINASQVFIEESATVHFSSLNATDGPIYIGKNALVMEGCHIRGPFVLGEGAVLKMGTKIYGATTIGPYCVGGGEIKNSVMMGFSNKAHDGYLGDSVIGEWCNLGAGTSNSNVKNNAGEVKSWNYYHNDYVPSGSKCGLIMGDYSRSSINTSFNTGTVVGISCNVFGQGLTQKFIADFTWGAKDLSRYAFDKALQHITNWMKFKNIELDTNKLKVLKHIFDHY